MLRLNYIVTHELAHIKRAVRMPAFGACFLFEQAHSSTGMTTNAKLSTVVSQLIEFGMLGATTAITDEPVAMPKMF